MAAAAARAGWKAAAVAVALLLALVAFEAATALPTITVPGGDIEPVRLAKAIVRKLKSTGGKVVYKANARVLGISPSVSTSVNYLLQFAYFGGASPSLLDPSGAGVAFSSLPVSNIATGRKDLFNNAQQPNHGQNLRSGDPEFTDIEVLAQGYQGANYKNYVVVEFDAKVPAGQLSIQYAFCTARPTPVGSGAFDIFMVSVEGVDGTEFPATNIAMLNDKEITPSSAFNPGLPLSVESSAVDLGSNITMCLRSSQATATLAAGVYKFRISTAQQNTFGFNNPHDVGPVFSFVAAGTCVARAGLRDVNECKLGTDVPCRSVQSPVYRCCHPCRD